MSGELRPTGKDSEHYYYASHDPHTAIPDWVPFCVQIGTEARNLITATLILQKRGHPPTRRELAEALSVDERSIYRWLEEITNAGAMSKRRAGRRRLNVFHRPKPDQAITDRLITDRLITDQAIRFRDSDESEHACQQSHKSPIPDQAISDPSGGGGDHDSIEVDPPPTTAPRPKISPSEITGDTGRWMVAEGFSLTKAHQHQGLPLAPAQADYQRRRQLGQGHGAIALAWEVAPPAGDLATAPIQISAGEFTFSEHEKERYRAMGFAFASEVPEEEQPTP
jgi:DNA-binding transcriptional ArsR family regulator